VATHGAIDDANKALALNPHPAGAYETRGLARLNRGKDAEAEADFKQCLELAAGFKTHPEGVIAEVKQRRKVE
jgi:Flp pilus assembly protein TadD